MPEKPSNPAVIEMQDVRVTTMRDMSHTVVEHVNWTVMPGDFWVVAGPQHSGKSDLLMHATGLIMPVEGICSVFGSDTRDFDEKQIVERLRVGVVFADGKLFNQFTIAENIALPLRYHKTLSTEEVAQSVAALLELLELTPWANVTPGSVAGVWRQRAA